MTRISVVVIALALFSANVSGSDLLYDTLKGGIDSRATSMGGSFTAIAEDGPGAFYNPAGAGIPGASYTYENLDLNKNRANAFYLHSLYLSPFVASFWHKEDFSGNHAEVSAFSYGRKGRHGIDWGVTYKSISAHDTNGDSSGWSSDFGMLFHLTSELDLGFIARDAVKENVKTPTTFALGLAAFSPAKDIVFSSDLVYEDDLTPYYATRFGAEYQIGDGLALRAGIQGSQWMFGGSVALPALQASFGGISPLQNNDNNPIYQLALRLGSGPDIHRYQKRYSLFKSTAYAAFRLDGNLIEGSSEISFLGGQKIGTNDLVNLIHEANDDISCKGFIIRIGNLSANLSSVGLIQDIRSELMKSKRKGKRIFIYLENWVSLPEYYLASVADRIFMPELGVISHLGLSLEILKTKDFLNNFGFDNEVMASGKYKASLSPDSEALSPTSRLMLDDLLGDLYHQVLADISEARKVKAQDLSEVFDGRILSARRAKEIGLIDELGYWDSLVAYARTFERGGADPELASLSEFAEEPSDALIFAPSNRIAVVEIDGTIMLGANQQNLVVGGKSTGADEIDALMDAISKEPSIRGVILRVNSPGGSIVAADRIYTSIDKLKKAGKLVYASMGNLAASGGYYVSLNTQKIFANPGTLTGAVGVISEFPNREGFEKILGIQSQVVKTGKYMDMMSQNRALSEEERKMLKDFQEEQYDVFMQRVMDSRHLSRTEAQDVAQGQVFSGKQALDLKMVDELGNFADAVDRMAKDANIDHPQLLFFRPRENSILNFIAALVGQLMR